MQPAGAWFLDRWLEGAFDVRGALRAPEGAPLGPRAVRLAVRVQPCDDQGTCLEPRTHVLELKLRFAQTSGSVRHVALFEK